MIKKISTKELAKCIGKSEGFASQIKNGWRKLPAKYCVLVSESFGIALHDLRPDIFPNETHGDLAFDSIDSRVIDLKVHNRRKTDHFSTNE